MANTKFKVILGMLFLKMGNVDMSFDKKTLISKSFITSKTLSTTKFVQIINPKEFVIAVLDFYSETFVVYMAI